MKKGTKETKREPPEFSRAARNVAFHAEVFGELRTCELENIVSSVDREFRNLVESAKDAADFLETFNDAEARLHVEFLRDALVQTTPQSDDENESVYDEDEEEKKYDANPDPTATERETAISFLALRIRPDKLANICGLLENGTSDKESHQEFILGYDVKSLLRKVGFKWRGEYFENNWRELIREAARRPCS